jgi:peptide/nickel transport system substrate-binding protein
MPPSGPEQELPQSLDIRLLAERQWQLIDRRDFLFHGLRAGAALGLGGLMAACTPSTERSNVGTPSVGEPLTPQRGGSLRVAQGDGVPGDFFRGNVLGQQVFTYCQFAWPLFIAAPDGPDAVNALADGYDVTSDGLTHTMTLREGLTFHDGSPIDADAVVKNLRADFFEDAPFRDEGSYVAALLSFGFGGVVKSIEPVDELTLQMVLNQPRADIRRGLWYLYIMNPEILKRKDYGTNTAALRDAGSGPFRVTNFSPSEFVEYERFDAFFEEVYLDRLRIEMIEDDAAMGLALRSGDIDVAVALGKVDYEDFAADPSFQALVAPRAGLNTFLDIQSPRVKEMEDPRVREAVILAMNRPAYREAFYPSGAALPDTQPVVVAGGVGYNTALEERPYDPDRARQLLADAGVENLTLKAISTSSAGYLSNMSQFWEAIHSDLQAVGINLEITITDAATTDAEWPNNDLRIDVFDDEYEWLVFPIYYELFNTDPKTDPRATNPEVKRLLTAAQQSADPAEVDQLLQELQQLDHNELIMAIPITVISKTAIARQGVHDFRVHLSADPLHATWIGA